jgi:hypothetical protein
MSSFLYEKGFIICAGVDYTFTPPSANQMERSELPDMNKHLTNLSINKTQEGHPGLVPCLMSEECPQVSIRFFVIILGLYVCFLLTVYL